VDICVSIIVRRSIGLRTVANGHFALHRAVCRFAV